MWGRQSSAAWPYQLHFALARYFRSTVASCAPRFQRAEGKCHSDNGLGTGGCPVGILLVLYLAVHAASKYSSTSIPEQGPKALPHRPARTNNIEGALQPCSTVLSCAHSRYRSFLSHNVSMHPGFCSVSAAVLSPSLSRSFRRARFCDRCRSRRSRLGKGGRGGIWLFLLFKTRTFADLTWSSCRTTQITSSSSNLSGQITLLICPSLPQWRLSPSGDTRKRDARHLTMT